MAGCSPHGNTLSVGTGSADKWLLAARATAELRQAAGLGFQVVRREGAPLPIKAAQTLGQRARRGARRRCRWRRGVGLSGEGIYYAMVGGRVAAEANCCDRCDADRARLRAGAQALHSGEPGGFWVLGIMQRFWYSSDKRREHFVSDVQGPDVQQLTFDAYMNKELVRKKPIAHVRIFFKDVAHLLSLAPGGEAR